MLVYNSSFISSDKPNCHFERPQGVEKSKSCKYNKYPEPSAKKRGIFMANELIFDTSAMKRGVFQAVRITIQNMLIKGVI